MYARSTTIAARTDAMDAGIAHVNDVVIPMLMDVPGCIGLSLICDRASGRCIATSSWDSAEAMAASDSSISSVRADAADAFGGPIDSVQEWEIAVLHREHRAGESACVRCTWMQCAPEDVDLMIDFFNHVVLPETESMVGFRSASLFVDRASGRCVSATAWTARDTLERSRDRAQHLRDTATEHARATMLEVAEFDLAVAQLRVRELT